MPKLRCLSWELCDLMKSDTVAPLWVTQGERVTHHDATKLECSYYNEWNTARLLLIDSFDNNVSVLILYCLVVRIDRNGKNNKGCHMNWCFFFFSSPHIQVHSYLQKYFNPSKPWIYHIPAEGWFSFSTAALAINNLRSAIAFTAPCQYKTNVHSDI